MLKRAQDIIVSLPAIIILLPVYFVLWLLIKLDSKGPAVFKQERAGLHGKPFLLYKFRTMRTDVDPYGASPKSGEDARITKVGRWLREYSLDELPQLFNILKGEMSLIGPRPLYLSQMEEWNDRQRRRLEVKPGLTGLAQIRGRGELTREQKLEYDVEYVERQNFWFDLRVLVVTACQIFGKKQIYEKRYSEEELTRGDQNASN